MTLLNGLYRLVNTVEKLLNLKKEDVIKEMEKLYDRYHMKGATWRRIKIQKSISEIKNQNNLKTILSTITNLLGNRQNYIINKMYLRYEKRLRLHLRRKA